MKNPKKYIKYSFIFSIIAVVANLLMLLLDINSKVSNFYLTIEVVCLITSVISLIGFTIFNLKPIDYSLKHFKWYITIVCLACISSLILAIFAIMSVSSLNNYRVFKYKQTFSHTIETEGKVLPTAEELTKRIKALDEMLNNNTISQEEYDKLKQQILEELTK